MASTYGRKYKVQIDGKSHGESVKVRIEGVPEGTVIDYSELDDFLRRRSPLNEQLEGVVTERKEPDEVIWKEGVVNFAGRLGIVTKSVIEAEVLNKDVDPASYDELKYIPRPGHADFTLMMKDGIEADTRGGGRFSGRLTVGLCIAGGITKQLLKNEGIDVMTDVVEIGGHTDPMAFEDVVESAKARGDSVGGIVECAIMGVKPGSCGDAYFDGLEGRISEAVFGIPAIKGIEFGSGFNGARMLGSANNDEFFKDENGNVVTRTNNHGGILGGIASGMPIVFRAAIKPTSSILKKQKSINMKTGEEVEISVGGRHDPCIVFRAMPCIESAAAIAIYDALHESDEEIFEKEADKPASIESLRSEIDIQDDIILKALNKRLKAAKAIGRIKSAKGLPMYDKNREEDILAGKTEIEKEVLKRIIELTKKEEKLSFGLLGENLMHSYSPILHDIICDETGLSYEYRLFEKKEDELESFIKEGEWAGLNVTIPYKTEVIKYIDELSPEAAAIGAVNTIVRRNGKLVGYNTDYYGLKSMIDDNNIIVNGKRCAVLGNGGAAKAASQVLFDRGAAEVRVLSHKAIDESESFSEISDCEILLNATPVGMYPYAGRTIVNPGSFTKLNQVIDLIYNPLRTELVCQAKKNLIDSIGGLDMLIWQGIYSATLFGREKFEDRYGIFRRVKNKLLNRLSNIVLIGMPGSGKSTIGKMLAEKTGKEFYDTDSLIEAREGKNIPEIFKECGEEYFRDIERAVINELSEVKGAVISTGGGAVEREENYYSLAANGRILLIDRAADSLTTTGRPLSQEKGIERLYRMRFPLYRSWADDIIECNSKSVEEIIEDITEKI